MKIGIIDADLVGKKKSFREFCEANGDNSSSMRYLTQFELLHPEIAEKYFDMKWVD